MAPGRTASVAAAALVAIAVGGFSAWEIARLGVAPELRSPVSDGPPSTRKVASVAAARGSGLPQHPDPPDVRRVVQRMIIR